MENRRNYYRILEIQPDAPQEAIRQNYKILMQRLRMHPDYGGSHRDAVLINVAYDTLSDPQKRAEYDKKLLLENNIVQISQGNLKRNALFLPKRKRYSEQLDNENRRNYYRILQVQPDAHAAVIRERYKYLLKNSDVQEDLLHEAYVVLNNAKFRMTYDRLLKKYGHSNAAQRMKSKTDLLKRSHATNAEHIISEDENDLRAFADDSIVFKEENEPSPLISRYCYFCKTPHASQYSFNYTQLCPTCSSPLFTFEEEPPERRTRSLMRMQKTGIINFYVYWPGPKLRGRLWDLSPRGLRFSSEFGLDLGQIIKIDGEQLKAVAEVIHQNIVHRPNTLTGVRFLTVSFESAQGNFLNASA
ncbi:MAG: DnaJ domain-containing protein [Desulfovermiculus sp.]